MQKFLAEQIPWLKQKVLFSVYQNISKPSLQSQRAMHGVRQIDTLSVGLWRQHLPRLAGQLLQHGSITKELIEDGYEKDESWTSELADIEPDLSPSYCPDHHSLCQSVKRTIKDSAVLAKFALRRQIIKFR